MNNAERAFLIQQQLPESYLTLANRHFGVVLDDIVSRLGQGKPLLVGIHGSQGSGKSTLAAWLHMKLAVAHRLRVTSMSLDDFYLGKAARHELARTVHPLLGTRGVPGTHDIPLALNTIDRLLHGQGLVAIPRFDKARDDSIGDAERETVQAPIDVVILEGWCLGALPQDEEHLCVPVNTLEATEDPDCVWRQYVNDALAGLYQDLFARVNVWVMLAAPGFNCVYEWRLEQENKLAGRHCQGDEHQPDCRNSGIMTPQGIARFVQFFQRITEYALETLPGQVDHLYRLDKQRQIVEERHD